MSLTRLTPRAAAIALAAVFVAGLLVEAVAFASRASDPSFVFLVSSGRAQWIRHARAMEMALLPLGTDTTGFRVSLHVDAAPAQAVLRFRALNRATVLVDTREVFNEPAAPANWKVWREIELSPYLSPGGHVVTIVASRENGPPLLQAKCDALHLTTGTSWEASRDNVAWSPAATADSIAAVPGSRAFPRTDRALLSVLPSLLPVFLFAAALRWAWLKGRFSSKHVFASQTSPRLYSFAILTVLAVLLIRDMFSVPEWFGFDIREHMEYIDYIVRNHRIPLAPEGWKMNEAPLFHVVSSVPYRFLFDPSNPRGNVIAMRAIPVLCGLGQAVVAWRTLRLVFPDRAHAQMIGVTLCALLPMNIYLSLFASNQPFVGLWSALAVFLTLRAMVDTRSDARYAEAVLIGLCLGLAILSKITGLLVVPGAVLGLAYASWRRQGRAAQAALVPAATIAVMLGVCGWYFVRNMLQIGTPFSVGFSEALNTVWRQDPGFRAPGQFLRFGEALWYPVHSGFVSFWDSIYSTFWSDGFISSGQVPPGFEYISYAAPRPSSVPPWDFKFLGAATLLSIGPMLLIALGVVRSLARPVVAMDRGLLLCLFWIGTHLAAMVYLYLTLPMVSAGKAAYLLNVLPCFGLLAAHGLEAIERRPILDAIATGAVATWAVASYAAFFVR